MSVSGAMENARTLAGLLGVSEEESGKLLKRRILVTVGPSLAAKKLASEIEHLLHRTFEHVDTDVATSPDNYSAEIVVGDARTQRLSKPAVFASIGLDEVRIDLSPTQAFAEGECHHLILLIGACYVAGAAARLVVPELALPPFRAITVSAAQLLGPDIDVLSKRVSLGEAHMAGAGAIGNAVLWALSALDVHGKLHVCDPDTVSAGNLNRCHFFVPAHVGQRKAEVLCREAQESLPSLLLAPFPERIENFEARTDGRTFDRLIVGVDSRRARRTLQMELPHAVFDASTTGIEEVVLHFNKIPLTGACLSCVYHQEELESSRERHVAEVLGVDLEDVRQNWISASAAARICVRYPSLSPSTIVGEAYDSLFKALCGQGVLKSGEGRQVLAPFSFVSALAGALLVLEIARRCASPDSVAPFNYWRVSPFSKPQTRMRAHRPQNNDCSFCQTEMYHLAAHRIWG